MSLSTKLQSRVTIARRKREETQQRHRKFYNIGAALGLTAGIAAFVYGAQHPTYTLPPVPVTPVETPVTVAPPVLEQPKPTAAEVFAAAREEALAAAQDYRLMQVEAEGTCADTLYEINSYVDSPRGIESTIGGKVSASQKAELKSLMREVTGC